MVLFEQMFASFHVTDALGMTSLFLLEAYSVLLYYNPMPILGRHIE